VDQHHSASAAAVIQAASFAALALFAAGASALEGLCRVPLERIEEAMRRESVKGYDLERTSNGVRLQAAVILDIVRERARADPARRPLWIGHADYFNAYLNVTGLTAENAPTFARVGHEYGENYVVDHRAENVVDEVRRGQAPDLAINVISGWMDAPGAPDSYTYEDYESDPPLRVTHERINSYRILTYDDVVIYDAIEGIRGRATGGLLGLMFNVIGDGRAERARFTFTDDGLQITRSTARKGPLRVTQTATVFPDGVAIRGLPDERPDLEAIEDLLRTPLTIRYVELEDGPMPVPPVEDCPGAS
jgi:hypothetical protein